MHRQPLQETLSTTLIHPHQQSFPLTGSMRAGFEGHRAGLESVVGITMGMGAKDGFGPSRSLQEA